MSSDSRRDKRDSRHRRVRRKVCGTASRPRMAMMISCRYMYVQFIDDETATTMASVSTLGADGKNNIAAAKALGKKAAEVALAAGVKRVVVDRGGFKFHGRVKAIVDSGVEAGLSIVTNKEK